MSWPVRSLLCFSWRSSPRRWSQKPGDLADPEPIQLKAARLPDEVSAPTLEGKVIDEAWLKVDPYDRRDTTDFNPYETLGRAFIVKYTRLFDF